MRLSVLCDIVLHSFCRTGRDESKSDLVTIIIVIIMIMIMIVIILKLRRLCFAPKMAQCKQPCQGE